MEAKILEQIPIEEEHDHNQNPEDPPYLIDLKTFMSEHINLQYQVFLYDMPRFCHDNPKIEEKFLKFFQIEFQKQLKTFEIFKKLEECYSDPNLKKIVPQISFIFSCPNLTEIPRMREYLKYLGDPEKRTERIQEMRKLHKLENPHLLKLEKKNILKSILDMNMVKISFNRLSFLRDTKKILTKIEKTSNNLQNSGVISKESLKNLSSPTKAYESIKSIDMSSIKKKISDNTIDEIRKKISDELTIKINENQDNFVNLEEINGISAYDIKNNLNKKLDFTENDNDAFEPLINSNSVLKRLSNENASNNNKDNMVDIITNNMEMNENKVENLNENNIDENKELYLINEDINMDEFKSFLVTIFNKLDDVKSLIFHKAIIQYFPKLPINYLNYLNDDGSMTPLNLYFTLIAYFSTIVYYFTGLKSKYYIDEADCFNVDFYLDELKLREVAKQLNYKLQFKIISKLKDFNDIEERDKFERLDLDEYLGLNNLPYEELDHQNISHFPPFDSFSINMKCRNYYRRFDNEKADEYHLCNKCARLNKSQEYYLPQCGSSYFRHIDKERIVSFSLESVMDIRKLMERLNRNEFEYKYLLMEVFHIHNYETFDDDLSQKRILNTYSNILHTKEVVKLNNTLRKFLGEEFGFYYFWLTHLISMLIYPTIIGILVILILFILKNYIFGINSYYEKRIDIYFMLPFSAFIIIWGYLYYQSWQAQEKFYKHNWGMTEYFMDESLYSIKQKHFKKFLDLILPEVDMGKMVIKKIVSSILTICLFSLCILLNMFVFWIQGLQTNQNAIDYQSQSINIKIIFWFYFVPILMYFTREFMTFCYYNISKRFTKWEGNITYSDYRYSFILKASFFQFINYYFNLYYIAYIKRYYNSCLYNNCKEELAQQLSIILTTAIIDDLRSLLWLIYNSSSSKISILFNFLKKEYQTKDNDGSNKNHFYQRKIYNEKNADKEYIQIIMTYGYVVQFGTASPICFLLAIIQAYTARITDSIRMTKYYHVNNVDGSSGLGSHLRMIYFLNLIGLISNITINLFSDDQILDIDTTKRWLILFLIENFLLIVLFFMSYYSTLPYWFKKYRNKTKLSYLKAFYGFKETINKRKLSS